MGVRALTSEDECARHYAEAITDLEMTTIEREEYFEILSENPEYLVDLLHVFINRLNHTEKKLEGFILTDATAREAQDKADRMGNFYNVGFMGGGLALGWGAAMSEPYLPVVVVDGDQNSEMGKMHEILADKYP